MIPKCDELSPGSHSRRCVLEANHEDEHRSELSTRSYVYWLGAAYPVLFRGKHDGWEQGSSPYRNVT